MDQLWTYLHPTALYLRHFQIETSVFWMLQRKADFFMLQTSVQGGAAIMLLSHLDAAAME